MKAITIAYFLPSLAYGFSAQGGRLPSTSSLTVSKSSQRWLSSGPYNNQDQEINFDARKTKEWIDRSIDFVSDLNREMTPSAASAEQDEKSLKTLKKWLNKGIDILEELANDVADDEIDFSSKLRRPTNIVSVPTAQEIVDDRVRIVENTAELFRVEIEVPGVAMKDVDIQIDKDTKTMTVLGERPATGAIVLRGIVLDPAVDVEKISAVLENGILTITAPKVIKGERRYRIPITSGSST